VGEAMERSVSHRRAEHFAKRGGAEARVVIDVATGGTPLPNALVRMFIEFEQVDPRSCHRDELFQDARDKATSRSDLVDLRSGEARGLSPHQLRGIDARR